ncbi:MAG: hypothetical protein QM704_09665 [Anaeromyxobacteraceae bacterium]
MPEPHVDAVLAGTKGFALALFVPLTERVGIRPRVATDATQALTLLESPKGLVVVEIEGEGTVRSIRELLATRKDFTVVAAVPDAQAGTEQALRALGVELARWDGSPAAVLGAVSRRLGTNGSSVAPPPPAPPPPVAAAPVAPASAVAAPRAPVAAPPPAVPSAPAPAPAAAYFGDLKATKPAPPPPLELEDEAEDVVSIEDLGVEEDLGPDAAAAPAVAAAPAPAPAAAQPPAAGQSAAWPAGGLTSAEAQKQLGEGLAGRLPSDAKLRPTLETVLSNLSALEANVLTGQPVAVKPEPLRRAAVMRLRVAHALAGRPPPGSPVDQAALSTMLGEIDALLSDVNALLPEAPDDVVPSLEAVRNALVKEAIDFSEAAQDSAPAQPVGPDPAAHEQARTAARAARARLISVSKEPVEPEHPRRFWVMVALLVIGALGAGGFHAWRYTQRQQAVAAVATVPGQPAGMYLVPGPPGDPKVFIPYPGAKLDPVEVARFKTDQQAKGLVVEELKGGALRIREPQQGRTR